jgi:hypothetical protein
MIIVAGGDSHVWGSELADSPHGGPNGYSRNTFTALLAGNDYICTAYPGIGNYEIAQRAREELHKDSPKAVIVCWTWPSRDTVYTSPRVIQQFQEYCEYHDVPYLFTCVDNCLIELLDIKTNWDHWYMFPAGVDPGDTLTPRGFYQWAVENKYNIGTDGHPLEDAHKAAAELIKEKFNELVKKSIQSN